VGRAFIATSPDAAVRMVLSSLPPAHQLLLPRLRQLSFAPAAPVVVAPAPVVCGAGYRWHPRFRRCVVL
jgi:hypothetical protein